jgi:tyrosine-protein phosphatase YwqE
MVLQKFGAPFLIAVNVLPNSNLIHEIADAGGLFQITGNSITGFWGRSSQKLSEALLNNHLVDFIASDAHG